MSRERNGRGCKFRQQQQKLLGKGRWADAIAMDITNVKRMFPTKYSKGLGEMVDYARSQGLITDAQKKKLKGLCK